MEVKTTQLKKDLTDLRRKHGDVLTDRSLQASLGGSSEIASTRQ